MLFGKDGVGINKIKQVAYNIYAISSLTNSQIQNVIKNVTSVEVPETVSSGNDHTNAEVRASSNVFRALSPKDNILPENKIHDHAYFRNKTFLRYSNLYKVFISEKFDRYGIIEGSLCPVCKQDHEDGKSVKAYTEETGLDPWVKPESSRIEKDADDNILQDSLPETQIVVPNKIYTSNSKTAPNKNHLYQYAIEHGINSKEFSIITEVEKIGGP
ncbi:7425_t:CDS:2 [Acaulospora colombiana]|uniref:7425_t:CDS:1 n=1 Tax=Acaulospora colombiana TaxID=27376 RepID=A0ACA9JZY9_9GLOM|nr:7425_t:CDS:2 [Acaulospora colombiana]